MISAFVQISMTAPSLAYIRVLREWGTEQQRAEEKRRHPCASNICIDHIILQVSGSQ